MLRGGGREVVHFCRGAAVVLDSVLLLTGARTKEKEGVVMLHGEVASARKGR